MKDNKKAKVQKLPEKISGISKRGWKVILAGIVTLVLGYFVLSKTDPAGRNWASNLSPFLILGGYILIGIGIIVPGVTQNDAPEGK